MSYYDRTELRGVLSAVVVIFTTLLVTWFPFRKLVRRRRRLPPGPEGFPVLGSLPYLGTHPHKSLRDLSKTYGPIMFMHLGSVPTLVVSSADMAKQILKTNDQNMASRPEMAISNYITYNGQDVAYAPYGDHWRKVRKICTLKLFTAARINKYQDMRHTEVLELLQAVDKECQAGKPFAVHELIANLSTNTMTQMMWSKRHCGITGDDSSASEEVFTFGNFSRAMFKLLGAVNIGDFVPALKPLAMKLQGFDSGMRAVRQSFDNFIDNIIEEHEDSGAQSKKTSDGADFVDLLLSHTKGITESEDYLSIEAVKAILTDMLNAGTDTTTTTLEWALTELVRQPNLLSKVQDELKTVVGPHRLVKDSDIPNLTYLDAVVKETFRMHPAGPLLVPHKSLQDCLIQEYHIPAETTVLVNVHAVHRNPASWDRPDDFNPERFVNSSIDVKGQNFELLPFGAGRRMCPAMPLGLASIRLALASLVHAFDWRLPDHQRPEDLDMDDNFGLSCPKAIPLEVLAKPILPHHIIYPDSQ